MICILYYFYVKPGCEDAFQKTWYELTLLIRAEDGGLGSRLHRPLNDGPWMAYAQWPDLATNEAYRAKLHPERRALFEALESTCTEIKTEGKWHVEQDLLLKSESKSV